MTEAYLHKQWFALTDGLSDLRDDYYHDLIRAWSHKKRHYHSLSHLSSMLQSCDEAAAQIVNIRAVRLAIWYHDAVYKVSRKDNEEKSAALARYQLSRMGINNAGIRMVEELILASKTHQLPVHETRDFAWFLDFDLKILGAGEEAYGQYARDVRKEYAIYPSFLYKKGRKKALLSLLNRKRIFQTAHYHERYEQQARSNLRRELSSL